MGPLSAFLALMRQREQHEPLPRMPPNETALRGGFYMPPSGPAPQTLPFRPPEQPVNEPPRRGLLAQLYRKDLR